MPEPKPVPVVLTPSDLDPLHIEALLGGAVVAPAETGVFEITGSATVDCLQGLLTIDLKGAGESSVVYGAALTPKGMIVTDMWIARQANKVWLTTPAVGQEPLLEMFRKYLPPRLATVGDRTDEYVTLRIAGPRGIQIARTTGIDVPDEGMCSVTIAGGTEGTVATPQSGAPFALQIQARRDRADEIVSGLEAAGALIVSPDVLDAARILAGWPDLGAEIDQKTMPQEVRFDEHGGVSYTKGCYTGQETVARLHFRGHANRELVGLTWEEEPPDPTDDAIVQGNAVVGRVSSVAWVEAFSQWVGLGILHRKANREKPLDASRTPATVVGLPVHIGL